jgi:hypothetical protein
MGYDMVTMMPFVTLLKGLIPDPGVGFNGLAIDPSTTIVSERVRTDRHFLSNPIPLLPILIDLIQTPLASRQRFHRNDRDPLRLKTLPDDPLGKIVRLQSAHARKHIVDRRRVVFEPPGVKFRQGRPRTMDEDSDVCSYGFVPQHVGESFDGCLLKQNHWTGQCYILERQETETLQSRPTFEV